MAHSADAHRSERDAAVDEPAFEQPNVVAVARGRRAIPGAPDHRPRDGSRPTTGGEWGDPRGRATAVPPGREWSA